MALETDASPVYEPLHPVHVFDLHCDTLDLLALRDREPYAGYGLNPGDEGFCDLASNRAAVSLDRMEDFAWCQCFAVWVPDLYRHHDAYDVYVQARDFFYRQVARHADRVEHVRDARLIDGVLARGKVAALLTLENSTPVNHSVYAIHRLAEDGVKMVTLTWNGRNAIGSGHLTDDGLTTFGREAVRAYEDERIVVDVSHLNDAGFADLTDIVRRPFVASHSNARAVCPNPRNLTDYQFCAIRDMGGLVGLNLYTKFITERPVRCTPCGGGPGVTGVGGSAAAGAEEGRPEPGDVTFDELAAHIEHFLDLGGEDVLALGSDWDGSDVPTWLATCDTAGELRHLLARRFGDELADKICFTNARDFFVRNETA